MKLKQLIVVSFILLSLNSYSQTGNSSRIIIKTFKVFGVCEQCKHRIEGALKIKSISSADWNIDTKMLTVTYDSTKISIDKIYNRIIAVGHDTYLKKANSAVYNSLPKCCYYRDMVENTKQTETNLINDSLKNVIDTIKTAEISNYIKGVVMEEDKSGSFKPLIGASVFWLGTNKGTTTDENGTFSIGQFGQRIIVSYTGLRADTISVLITNDLKIILAKGKQLSEVKVTTARPGTYINSYEPFRTAVITQKELFKAACCNLSESFETNPSVDVSYNDAVTGSKQIQLLGLAGIYTQLTVENLPGLRGLATPLGLNSISGTWIESLQLSKGTGSVANGFESIAGQINVELKKPQTSERLFANMYVNDLGKTDLNLNLTQKLNNNWATTVLLHDDFLNKSDDFNKDGFKDLPTGNLFSLINRWSYDNNKGFMSQFGIKYLYDNKTGGQTDFTSKDKFTTNSYGLGINTIKTEGFAKIGYVFPEKKYKSIGLQLSAFNYNQTSFFGLTNYDANQKSFYANLLYQSIIKTSKNKFRTGISFVSDNYNETYKQSNYKRIESIPGAFFEYTFSPTEIFDLVAGIREDHNSLFGLITTPRLNLRYEPVKGTTIRASIGKGQRTANIFAENNGIFISSRQLEIIPSISNGAYGLKPEIAWNKGISIDQKLMLFNKTASIGVDFYRNDFTDQVIVDIENPRLIKFYNLQGKSYSNSFQAELNFMPVERLDIKLAYRLFDVKSTYDNELLPKPLISKDRGFANLEYGINGWKFDYTLTYNGKKRLPSTIGNPDPYLLPAYSPSFIMMNAQVSKSFGKNSQFEIYAGSENLTNYIQKNAIIASDQPFGQYFDASLIWGSITGRMLYSGLRFKIKAFTQQ